MIRALAVTTAVAATAVLTAGSPAQAATCGTLPAQVQGSPAVRGGQAGTTYLWHDAHGWHLRVTHPGTARVVVTGTLTASSGFRDLSRVHLERGNTVALSRDGRTLAFRMTNVGHLDGFDVRAECSRTLRVALKGTSTQQVFLGAHRVHPTSVPFTVERH